MLEDSSAEAGSVMGMPRAAGAAAMASSTALASADVFIVKERVYVSGLGKVKKRKSSK